MMYLFQSSFWFSILSQHWSTSLVVSPKTKQKKLPTNNTRNVLLNLQCCWIEKREVSLVAQYSGTSTMASITNSNRSVSPRLGIAPRLDAWLAWPSEGVGTEVEECPEREPGVKLVTHKLTQMIRLMEEILHWWICSLSHHLQYLIDLRWCRSSSINSIIEQACHNKEQATLRCRVSISTVSLHRFLQDFIRHQYHTNPDY